MESCRVREVNMVVEEDIKSCSHFTSFLDRSAQQSSVQSFNSLQTRPGQRVLWQQRPVQNLEHVLLSRIAELKWRLKTCTSSDRKQFPIQGKPIKPLQYQLWQQDAQSSYLNYPQSPPSSLQKRYILLPLSSYWPEWSDNQLVTLASKLRGFQFNRISRGFLEIDSAFHFLLNTWKFQTHYEQKFCAKNC